MAELRWAAASLDNQIDQFGECAARLSSRLRTFESACRETQLSPPREKLKLGMRHDDLHPGNIIVDPSNYSIVGVLDWEHAGVGPLDAQWLQLEAWAGEEGSEAWSSLAEPALKSLNLVRPDRLDERRKILDLVNQAVWCIFFYSSWYSRPGTSFEERYEAWFDDMRGNIQRMFKALARAERRL